MALSEGKIEQQKSSFLVGSEKLVRAYKVALLLMLLVTTYVVFSQRFTNEEREFSSFVLCIERMEQAMYKMEGANNGFLLTGDSDFRSNFSGQRDILSDNYREVAKKVKNSPIQSACLKRFKAKLTDWFAFYNPMIMERRSIDDKFLLIDSTKKKNSLIKSKLLFSEMLVLLNEIRSEQTYRKSLLKNSDGTWFFQFLPDQGDPIGVFEDSDTR